MIEAGLIASRFLHYVAVLTLFGGTLFPLYGYGAQARAFGPAQIALVARLRLVLWSAAVLALVSGVGWFAFTAAAMAGDLSAMHDLEVWRTVMGATDFGTLWIARLALTLALAVFLVRWPRALSYRLVPVLALVLLGSLAATGHARVTTGAMGDLHAAVDALHLLAAGAWLGGLWPLALMLAAAGGDTADEAVGDMLTRFSSMGVVAVAALVATGFANSWFLVGSVQALTATPYGAWLLVKLALFALMLLLAAANRFWIAPRFASASPGTSTAVWLRRIRRQVAAEQVLGVAVVAIVSLLGTMTPAASS